MESLVTANTMRMNFVYGLKNQRFFTGFSSSQNAINAKELQAASKFEVDLHEDGFGKSIGIQLLIELVTYAENV